MPKTHISNPDFDALHDPLVERRKVIDQTRRELSSWGTAALDYSDAHGCTPERGPNGWRFPLLPEVQAQMDALNTEDAALWTAIGAVLRGPVPSVLCGSTSATKYGRVRTGTRTLHSVSLEEWVDEDRRFPSGHPYPPLNRCARCAARLTQGVA